MNKTTTGQENETEPIEDVINKISDARDIALDLNAKVYVFGRLFLLKRNDNEGDFAFNDGIRILNDELGDKIDEMIDILDSAESQANLCKTDEEKIEAEQKEREESERHSKKLKEEWGRMEKNMEIFREETATESTDTAKQGAEVTE